MRKPYLDNLRSGTVILVLVFHVFYLFNSAGVPGALGNPVQKSALDAPLYFVYPWFMVLLFLIAGICTKYSLQKRSDRQFIKDRTIKLLVPSTLGLFVYHWISGYLNLNIGGGLEFIPKPLVYPIAAISGIGPLWFVQTLFLFCVLLVLLRRLDRKEKLWELGGKLPAVALPLLVFPIWGAAQLLNMPLLTMYRFGIYGLAFLLGYYVFSHEAVQDSLVKMRVPLLVTAVVCGVFYTVYYLGTDFTSPQCLQGFFTNAYLWVAVLAALGCGKAWLNHKGRFSEYLTRSSFGFYIVHYPIALFVCSALLQYSHLPVVFNYCAALIVTLGASPLVYELFRRIPVIRFLVLGIKKGE